MTENESQWYTDDTDGTQWYIGETKDTNPRDQVDLAYVLYAIIAWILPVLLVFMVIYGLQAGHSWLLALSVHERLSALLTMIYVPWFTLQIWAWTQ